MTLNIYCVLQKIISTSIFSHVPGERLAILLQ
jgi:hypothetical protein